MSHRSLCITALFAVFLSASAWPCAAQVPEPYGGSFAIGGAIGGAVPVGERLDNGFYAGATLVLSIASHAALSAEAGANRVDVDRPGFRSDLMPRFADLNLLVHWRRGPFRPFITGGVGVYRYTITVSREAFIDPALRNELVALGLNPAVNSAPIETRHDETGINLGGGFEYFFTRRSAVMMDVRAHRIPNFVQIAPFDGTFVNVAVGFKQYF
jgi:Outer membrane protein beta-barrel domain